MKVVKPLNDFEKMDTKAAYNLGESLYDSVTKLRALNYTQPCFSTV